MCWLCNFLWLLGKNARDYLWGEKRKEQQEIVSKWKVFSSVDCLKFVVWELLFGFACPLWLWRSHVPDVLQDYCCPFFLLGMWVSPLVLFQTLSSHKTFNCSCWLSSRGSLLSNLNFKIHAEKQLASSARDGIFMVLWHFPLFSLAGLWENVTVYRCADVTALEPHVSICLFVNCYID